VLCAFAAPFLEFLSLWGAHFTPDNGAFFGALAVGDAYSSKICYLVVFIIAMVQMWLPGKENTHA